MNDLFEKFLLKLKSELEANLPGFSAQKRMAPLGRKPPIEYLKENMTPKNSAVLILLYPDPETSAPKTVLILRPENEQGNHAGQVSFPGGGFDHADVELSNTALREAEEEIGLDRSGITLLGGLTPLYIPVSNYMVHPFVGFVRSVPEFNINREEVQEVLECNAEDFLREEFKGSVSRHIKIKNAWMEVPCYNINNRIIWGATAMIISEFEEVMKRAK